MRRRRCRSLHSVRTICTIKMLMLVLQLLVLELLLLLVVFGITFGKAIVNAIHCMVMVRSYASFVSVIVIYSILG